MLEMLFTIGILISALILIYGAYLTIDHVLFGEHRTHKTAAEKIHELPEIAAWLGNW